MTRHRQKKCSLPTLNRKALENNSGGTHVSKNENFCRGSSSAGGNHPIITEQVAKTCQFDH